MGKGKQAQAASSKAKANEKVMDAELEFHSFPLPPLFAIATTNQQQQQTLFFNLQDALAMFFKLKKVK